MKFLMSVMYRVNRLTAIISALWSVGMWTTGRPALAAFLAVCAAASIVLSAYQWMDLVSQQ